MQCVNSHDQHLAGNHKLELCGSLPEVRCCHQTGILPHTLERTGTVALLHKVERDIQLIRYPHCRGQPEVRTVRFWQRHSNSCCRRWWRCLPQAVHLVVCNVHCRTNGSCGFTPEIYPWMHGGHSRCSRLLASEQAVLESACSNPEGSEGTSLCPTAL
jgi:hypothetical protein